MNLIYKCCKIPWASHIWDEYSHFVAKDCTCKILSDLFTFSFLTFSFYGDILPICLVVVLVIHRSILYYFLIHHIISIPITYRYHAVQWHGVSHLSLWLEEGKYIWILSFITKFRMIFNSPLSSRFITIKWSYYILSDIW